ncbi:MAG: magnesium transporter CorA family protein [Treponema sp.]|nr:magnesium transporter CorA family protein [Treponema sp.]
MITYWQQKNGQFFKSKKEKIDPEEKVWVDARILVPNEIELLQNEFKIDPDHLRDIIDSDELSRLEDGDGYILTIIRFPFYNKDKVQYLTAPLGIIIQGNYIITICSNDCEVIRDFTTDRVKGINLSDFPTFIIRILDRANATFLRYLREINRRSNAIQNELQTTIENKEILQLFAIETSLIYFSMSLKSNQLLLEKFRKTKLLKLDSDAMDWLDDAEVDNKQAIEMTDNYQNILMGATNTFNSVTNNDLNSSMRRLSILNLILMVPTFITSFMGMNVELPFVQYGKWAAFILSILCILSAFVTNLVLNFFEHHHRINEKSKKRTEKKRKERKKAKRK